MNKKRFLFIHNIWMSIALGIIVLLFISHLVAFFLLSRYNEQTQLAINRGIAARQIITLIQAVEINPPDKRAYIVNAIDVPNVYISLNKHPKYAFQVSKFKIWDVLAKLKKIPKDTRTIEISVKLDEHLWLNISALILQSSLTFQVVLFAFELIIILTLLFLIISLNRFNKPLKRFVIAVERMGRTLEVKKLSETDGPQMVREAAKAVNIMQEHIKKLIHDRTQMLAAISHDLRTPLTRIKLRAQFIPDEEQQQKIIQDLDEMERMISESLTFFREEQQPIKKAKIDLASLLSSLCTDYQETKNKVSYQGPTKNEFFYGNTLALKRTFSNIIDNALKYGQSANITFFKNKFHYIINIDDKGPGMTETEMKKAFAPFYRGEQSRSRTTGGIGLGLAVARNVILAHDGEVSLKSIETGGLRVSIRLPLTH